MYEPNFGQILLDGRSIQDYESGFFHQQVVHVSSEVELLNRSIKENVQYGIMGASEIGKEQRKKILDEKLRPKPIIGTLGMTQLLEIIFKENVLELI